MSEKINHVPPKINLGVRLRPSVHKSFQRQADDDKQRPATLAENIIEAFTRGLFFCPLCYMPHKPREGCHG